MLHFDDGFADASRHALEVQPAGGVQISLQESVFGAGSADFNNNGAVVSARPVALGDGDFTIELWAHPRTFGFEDHLFYIRTEQVGGGSAQIYLAEGTFQMIQIDLDSLIVSGPALALGAWSHLVVVRHGGSVTLYTNGVPGTPGQGVHDYPRVPIFIGGAPSANGAINPGFSFDGLLDELRVTVGVARYTADFRDTVPSAPLADAK